MLLCLKKKIPKKRGRKPKGGKIIKNVNIITDKVDVKKNIILHLKCFKTDININGYDSIVHDVEPFVEDTNFQEFNYIETKEKLNTDNDFNEKNKRKSKF